MRPSERSATALFNAEAAAGPTQIVDFSALLASWNRAALFTTGP